MLITLCKMAIEKKYRNCVDCGKEKYANELKLCRECKREELLKLDAMHRQKITIKNFM